MASILDDHSALHNLKQRRGLNRATNQSIQPYLDECALRNRLREGLAQTTIRELSKASGFSTFRIRELIEDVVLDLGVRGIREATQIFDREGISECLRYLNEA